MKKLMYKCIKNYHIIALVLLFVSSLIILSTGGYFLDDYTYKQIAIGSFSNAVKFMKWHIAECNGRTVIHIILLLFLRYNFFINVWRVLCAAGISAVSLLVGKIAACDRIEEKTAITTSSIAFMTVHPMIWRTSVYWLTGSINYLFPAVLLLTVMYLTLKKQSYGFLTYFLALFSSCLHEQNGMVVIGLFALIMIDSIIRQHRFHSKAFIGFLLSVCGFLTIILSPGTLSRANRSSEHGSPFFNLLYILKANWFENYYILFFNIVISLCLIYWMISLSKKTRFYKVSKTVSLICFVAVGLNAMFTVYNHIFGFSADDSILEDVVFLLWCLFVLFIIALFAFLSIVLYFRKDKKLFLFATVLGIGSQLMLIVVAKSGYRTMTPMLLMLFIIAAMTACSIVKESKALLKSKNFNLQKCAAAVIAFVTVVNIGYCSFCIVKDITLKSPPSRGVSESFLGEDGNLRKLSDKETDEYLLWISDAVKRELAPPDNYYDIKAFNF